MDFLFVFFSQHWEKSASVDISVLSFNLCVKGLGAPTLYMRSVLLSPKLTYLMHKLHFECNMESRWVGQGSSWARIRMPLMNPFRCSGQISCQYWATSEQVCLDKPWLCPVARVLSEWNATSLPYCLMGLIKTQLLEFGGFLYPYTFSFWAS